MNFDELKTAIDNTRENAASKWKIKGLHGREIDLRAHFDRMAVWIQRFIAIGDTVVQYDPAHAALPWAALRFVLKVLILRRCTNPKHDPSNGSRFVSMILQERPRLSMVWSR